jgi:hypothetical protein
MRLREGKQGPHRGECGPNIGGMDVNNEFWLPASALPPVGVHRFVYERLSEREQAILRRLRRGHWPAKSGRVTRASRRERRRALEQLGINDLRTLLRFLKGMGVR